MTGKRNPLTEKTLAEIRAERKRQNVKWGEQDHDAFVWLGILMEEVGEVARAALEARFGNEPERQVEQYRRELTHVSAVAVAMIECLDRQRAKDSEPPTGKDTIYPEPKSAAEVVR